MNDIGILWQRVNELVNRWRSRQAVVISVDIDGVEIQVAGEDYPRPGRYRSSPENPQIGAVGVFHPLKGERNGQFVAADFEANVQPDWNAVSGGGVILNKPATFPPSPHNHDSRYYTESEVDTIVANAIAAAKPQRKSSSGLGIAGGNTVSTAGDYPMPNATITFTGLDTGRSYWLEWTIDWLAISSTGSGQGRLCAEVTHAGGVSIMQPNTYNDFINERLWQTRGDADSFTPNGSGQIIVRPLFRWEFGTTQFLNSYIRASVEVEP